MLEALETISKVLDTYPDTLGLEVTDLNAITLRYEDPKTEKQKTKRFETADGKLAGLQLLEWLENTLPRR
ncbi:hypothetical protein SAMN04489761_4315 [Tenacibaculum sp. MAR_2009_124]|uniref:hypothetical protein n=1 Tax=Tenacibaculum sp. MAR_2009_124 TaxID=1250059 RepID=UPI00089B0642|nr:hypothetical protein [Tenacibaculum sp. MAR_2009_124]SED11325.1 hypothetical protein SAMN04489761_4315 [Tenacibaculum sp. MAR_2009_124]